MNRGIEFKSSLTSIYVFPLRREGNVNLGRVLFAPAAFFALLHIFVGSLLGENWKENYRLLSTRWHRLQNVAAAELRITEGMGQFVHGFCKGPGSRVSCM